MGTKEDLEKLILDVYSLVRKNDRQIMTAENKEQERLRGENADQWLNLKAHLADYASLCEFYKKAAPDDIVSIAALRFPDIAARLQVASKTSLPPTHDIIFPNLNKLPVENNLWFKMDYKFACSAIPTKEEGLAQFVINFRCRDDVDAALQQVPTHICLVLDVSGSMNEPQKYPYLLKAIPHVIDALSDNDRLSIILFSAESRRIWSDTAVKSRKQKRKIIDYIDQCDIKFNTTYLAPGLTLALKEIESVGQDQPGIVTRLYVLTDGQLHDVQDSFLLNPELRRLEIEANSYGFGHDFAAETMRKIMDGCRGGRVKWVSDTEELWMSFKHIGDSARNIVASDAKLEIKFSPQVIPGDAFRFEPGSFWFGTNDDLDKNFYSSIGGLEKGRTYTYAFEARVNPSSQRNEQIAAATLQYTAQGKQQLVEQSIFLKRVDQQEYHKQEDQEIKDVFLVLEGLRSDDPESKRRSYEARVKMLRKQGGDIAQIQLFEKAIEELSDKGTLNRFSGWEMRQLDANTASTKVSRPLYYRDTDEQ